MVEFCIWLTIDMYWKLRDALEEMDKDNTHPSAFNFILFYEGMVQRFKEELRELKERK